MITDDFGRDATVITDASVIDDGYVTLTDSDSRRPVDLVLDCQNLDG